MTGVQTCALPIRSEEHTSELQSHGLISYAVSFCFEVANKIARDKSAVIVTIFADSAAKYLNERFWDEE